MHALTNMYVLVSIDCATFEHGRRSIGAKRLKSCHQLQYRRRAAAADFYNLQDNTTVTINRFLQVFIF